MRIVTPTRSISISPPASRGENKLRVAGNLPYNISTPLLFRLQNYRTIILDMHLMLQKEVVDRMVAVPGTKAYGRLTVMLSRWFDIEACFDIRPGSFRPQPRVMSTLVRLRVREQPRFDVADESTLSPRWSPTSFRCAARHSVGRCAVTSRATH